VLLTMLDLKWIVRVYGPDDPNPRYTWYYTFNRKGAVSWKDPYNGRTGNGTWKIADGTMTTRWVGSKTYEKWIVPINPDAAEGTCYMAEGALGLRAVALNYYLQPGDVVYSGEPIIRTEGQVATIVYASEFRTGGTIAWICNNPGNIRDGSKYGAIKGKQLVLKKLGAYAIFPDETTGLNAVVAVLKVYGRVTINQAMHKYAPAKDGSNKPDQYAGHIAAKMGVKDSAYIHTLDLTTMAKIITGVETTTPGTTYRRVGQEGPNEIRSRLSRPLQP
jgi:hypothetical protein